MKSEGIFSIEAATALSIVVFLALAFPSNENSETVLLQEAKASDLLIVWAMTESTESQMLGDAELLAGKNGFGLWVDGEELAPMPKGGSAAREIRSAGIFGTRTIRVSVGKN